MSILQVFMPPCNRATRFNGRKRLLQRNVPGGEILIVFIVQGSYYRLDKHCWPNVR
ncbi:MAG: hypothetical protein AAGB19_19980 [Cyanobacteria bacterium P01_F01_bin.3]